MESAADECGGFCGSNGKASGCFPKGIEGALQANVGEGREYSLVGAREQSVVAERDKHSVAGRPSTGSGCENFIPVKGGVFGEF